MYDNIATTIATAVQMFFIWHLQFDKLRELPSQHKNELASTQPPKHKRTKKIIVHHLFGLIINLTNWQWEPNRQRKKKAK